MTDIARLGFSADTSELKDATASLNAMVPAAKNAEAAARGVTAAAAGLAGGIKPFSAAVQQAATGAGSLSRSALMAGTAMGTVEKAAAGASASIGTLGGTVARVGMTFVQADAHVQAYKANLAGIAPAANGATSALNRLGASANDNINAMQSTPGNIAAQFQDIGVTAAAGMSPMLIALQQGTQLSAAFAGGGLKNLLGALKQLISPVSLLTIGFVALVAVGIQWAMAAFSAGDASQTLSEKLDKVKFASNAVTDAQGILTNVMDLATGKVNAQSAAFITLAKAQLLVARVQSQVKASEARTAITEGAVKNIAAGGGTNFQMGMAGGSGVPSTFRRSAGGDVANLFQHGLITADVAIDRLDTLRKAGHVTSEEFANLASNIANYGAEIANQGVFDDALRLLNGDTTGNSYLLKPTTGRTSHAKTEAQKFEDIVTGAQNDIATQKTRELNAAMADNVELTARAEQRTKLLNDVQTKGISLTPVMRDRIEELAVAYGKASAAASEAEAKFNIGEKADDQMRSLAQANAQVGVYGQALTTLRFQQDLLNQAEDAGIKVVGDLTDAQAEYVETLRQRGIAMGMHAQGTVRDQFMETQRKQHEDTMWAMQRERGEIGLVKEALAAYRYETDMLADARAKNIELTEPELASLKKIAAEHAHMVEVMTKAREALQMQRDIAKGFFDDWYEGIMQGKNIFDSFVDSVIKGLQSIAQKMLDRTIDKFLDMMFAGNNGTQGGGILGAILGAVSGAPMGGVSKSATTGGTGTLKGFAQGTVVTGPTLLSNARGAVGQMGEAGEEAIMPLTRSPDGTLGVSAHGAGGGTVINAPIAVNNHYTLTGAMSSKDIIGWVKQASEQTKKDIARELPQLLSQYQTDGAMV